MGKYLNKGGTVPFKNFAYLPKYIHGGKDFQLFISDYTLKAALETAVDLDLLKLTITQKDTKFMNTNYLRSFKELVKYYGKNKPVELNISFTKGRQTLFKLNRLG